MNVASRHAARLALGLTLTNTSALAQSSESLATMSLEELMNVDVSTGSLSEFVSKYSPSAITTITHEQIELTTARNVATLLEQHVPGLIVMTHSEGDKIGLRGLIAAENYKLLLLVNGKNVTNMVYEGAMLELDQWELGDIDRIEVIRGPGSVTYGSGAIAGVINIITKTADSLGPTESVAASYLPAYRSRGASVQHRRHYGKLGIYSFLSVRATEGEADPSYWAMAPSVPGDGRLLGKREGDVSDAQAYLADGLGRPQLKAHLDVRYGNDLRTWVRFTQSGQTHAFSQVPSELDSSGFPPDENRRQVALRSFAISPEYTHHYNEQLSLTGSFTYDNQEYVRHDLKNVEYSIEHPNNIRDYAFSQGRSVGRLMMNYADGDTYKLSAGYEFNHTQVRAPWGKSSDHLWIVEGTSLINSPDSSVYLRYPGAASRPSPDNVEAVGNGLDFNTHSYLLEGWYQAADFLRLMYSHRVDVPDVSSVMFSPRVSAASEITPHDILRLTAQRSLRMMPLRAQYLYDRARRKAPSSEHESLRGLELAYTRIGNENALINLNAFYNEVDAVGYTGEDLQFLSNLSLVGVELEPRLRFATTDLVVNHSWLVPLEVDMNDRLETGENRNNTSFADYHYRTTEGIPLLLEDYGNGLNNWSENTTKLLITQRFFDDTLIAHLNSRVFWDLSGSYDEMRMYQRAYDEFDTSTLTTAERTAFESQRSDFEQERRLLDAQDVYDVDLRVNVSLSYKWRMSSYADLLTTIYADNFIGSDVRYYVSTGSSRSYPERLTFMREPRAIGLRMRLDLH